MDIGSFNKRTLLTGAGWSRNWGGRLANEMWQDLMSHQAIQHNERLRRLLLDEQSFEVALGMTYSPPFTTSDRHEFERALLDAFGAMDRQIALGLEPWINIYKVQELLGRFSRQGSNAGYLFTLNQDIFLERHLYNFPPGCPPPSLPGLQVRPGQRFFSPNIGLFSDELLMQVSPHPAGQASLLGRFNIIKLHGSFNWRTADGANMMVVGTEKTRQISASHLLAWYFEIFQHVLSAGNVRLLIVGYGFGDEHINAVIADAIENHGLRVFIWDVGPKLRERVIAVPHGVRIWEGLLSSASRPMIEVFPSNQETTQEYRRIVATMFD
jgi:hypothetical protein